MRATSAVSALIRTYSNQATLEACVRSVLGLMWVDDVFVCSTDGPLVQRNEEIVSKIARTDSRIRFELYPHVLAPYGERRVLPDGDPRHIAAYTDWAMRKCIFPGILRVDSDCVVVPDGMRLFNEQYRHEALVGMPLWVLLSPNERMQVVQNEPKYWDRSKIHDCQCIRYGEHGVISSSEWNNKCDDGSFWWGPKYVPMPVDGTPTMIHYGKLNAMRQDELDGGRVLYTFGHRREVDLNSIFTPAVSIISKPPKATPVNGPLSGMNFHLQGLAHIPTRFEFSPCAYTGKIIRLARMIRNAGGYVTFYGDEGSEVDADEVVTVLSEKDRLRHYGDYDWHKDFFKHSADSEGQKKFDAATISAINMRKTKDDILLCPLGNYHKRVVDNVGLMSVESGIGYTGVYGKFLVFESDVWRHYVYGMMKSARGKAYDTVIPNVYDVSEFPFVDKKEDYYLYVGRLITSKGINVAAETVERVGGKLIVAGQGNLKDLGLANLKHVEHIGVADRTTVAELMGKARAVFVPTLYIEPFGGVAVEAQMCGTPVITSDWGAFVETVNHGVTGYRCNTLKDFVTAAENVSNIDCKACRAWATSRYSLDVGTRLYSNYFLRLKTLLYGGKGWYELT